MSKKFRETKKDIHSSLVDTFYVIVKNEASKKHKGSVVKIVGQNPKKLFRLFRDFLKENFDIDVCNDSYLTPLGNFDEDENLVEIKKTQTFSSKLLTLGHEVGHVLTLKPRQREKTREVLAEAFACISILCSGYAIKDYTYFDGYGDCTKVLVENEKDLKKAVHFFLDWKSKNESN